MSEAQATLLVLVAVAIAGLGCVLFIHAMWRLAAHARTAVLGATLMACGLLAIPLIMGSWIDHRTETCEASGGVYVHVTGTAQCLDPDAIVNVEGERE